MVQNAPHEPRNSICQVFSQDPSKMSGCLDNSPIVWFWIMIGGQYLKTVSLLEPINLFASPASGMVSLANGQVRGKCTNSCSFSCPFCNWTPDASSLVTPLEYRVRSMSYSPSARSRKASYAVSNLSWSEATDEASKLVHSESVEELSDTLTNRSPPQIHSPHQQPSPDRLYSCQQRPSFQLVCALQ